MTTRNVIKFAAIFMLCLLGGLAVTVVRIAGPAGLDVLNPTALVFSGNHGAYFRHKQWLADAKTLVFAVRFWFEPEHTVVPVGIPMLHSNILSAKIVASNAPAVLGSISSLSNGGAAPPFDGTGISDKLGSVSGAFNGTTNS